MYVRIATEKDINNFQMSEDDLKEQVASCNEYEFDNPQDYDVIVDGDNNVYALGGTSVHGTIWLLTSKLVEELTLSEKKKFIKLIRRQIESYKRHNKHRVFFYNTVWIRNTNHMNFIEACGGIFDFDKKYNTPIGETFVPFIIPNEYYGGKRCVTGK